MAEIIKEWYIAEKNIACCAFLRLNLPFHKWPYDNVKVFLH